VAPWLPALLFAAMLASCAPVPSARFDVSEELPAVELPDDRSIPAEWGNLVAVSNSPKFPEVFQLWFQNEAGEIHLVVFDNRSRSLVNTGRVIARN